MRISTQFTVSVHILMLIMAYPDKKITSEILSESVGSNPVMIRQLFSKLKEAGILNVSKGKGATELAKNSTDISLWDIYMATEGYNENELFKFHPNVSNGCHTGQRFKITLGAHLDEAVQAMSDKLSQVSLAQLSEEWASLKL